MKKSTRILALIVTVVMIISALSTLAFAADAPVGDVVTVGDGGDYETVAKAISAIGTDNLNGKTIKLASRE